MSRPYKQQLWCDTCGKPIERPEDGWVEWRNRGDRREGFRLVHHLVASPRRESHPRVGCYGDVDEHMSLGYFVGPNGLTRLLDIIDGPCAVDQAGFAELVRRLLVPGYEAARRRRGA